MALKVERTDERETRFVLREREESGEERRGGEEREERRGGRAVSESFSQGSLTSDGFTTLRE